MGTVPGHARGNIAETTGSILLLLQQKPEKALALFKTLRNDEADGRSALQGRRPNWHAVPRTPSNQKTPRKVEQGKKAVIGSKAKESLGLLVEHYKKKDAKPTAPTRGRLQPVLMRHTPQLSVKTCGAMRQRMLGSHTPPCHRRMVITT